MKVMIVINELLTGLFDLFFLPFISLSPAWALIAISVITGMVMVLIFRFTSNQAAIKATKQRIKGLFLEIRLYQDDLRQSLKAQRSLLRTNLTYMKYSVVPMLIMMIPVILILIQLHFRFSFRPIRPGEDMLVKVFIDSRHVQSLDDVTFIASEGITATTNPLRIPRFAEIDIRVRADRSGNHVLIIEYDGKQFPLMINAGSKLGMVFPEIMKPSWTAPWLYPGTPFIDRDAPVSAVSIGYPERSTPLAGIDIHWLITFFILSIIAGFAMKKPFGVEI